MLASCGLPGLDDPQLGAEAYLTIYEFGGRTTMASPAAPVPQTNPAQDLSDFGHDEQDDGYGGRVVLGDGFSGIETQFNLIDNLTTDQGTLVSPYGILPSGAVVATQIDMLELRAAYTGELLRYENELYEEPIEIRLGAGAALAHRQIEFTAEEVSTDIPQRNTLDDNLLPYATVRARIDYRNFGLQGDLGVNPDIDFGNEFDGVQTDFELRLDYTFDIQGVTVFGAWRRVELEGGNVEDGLPFANEFVMQGFTLGARIVF